MRTPDLRRRGVASLLMLLFAAMLCCTDAVAVNEKGDWPWDQKLHGWHDRAVAEQLGAGWFVNVGPTGIRARITHDHPAFFTVKFVFNNSPAYGKVKPGDIIVGGNGKRLTRPHQFGRRNITGWDGPMMDMATLIEESQGKDGKLELIIWPGGKKSDEKKVELQLKAVGRFSPTFPFNCPRSDKLMIDLCDFLANDYVRAGKFESRVHTHTSATLALMASGDKRYAPIVQKIMDTYIDNRYDSAQEGGFPAWTHAHDAILMGEYYLLTKDSRMLPAMQSLAQCLEDSQWPSSGGFSHKPFAAIQRRMAAGGPKGYGAMAMPGGLSMIGLSLFKEAGVGYAEPAYHRLHQAYLSSVSASGAIGYGFQGWDHAVIELADPKGAPRNSPRGIGYVCPDGMKNIGKYTVKWPTLDDPRYRPTDWLVTEKATNRVFDKGGKERLVVRTMAPPEPTRPYVHNGQEVSHFGRSGTGALAHFIGNKGKKPYEYLAQHMATGCAKSHRRLMDGHASTHMHVLWGSLGAALADEREFQAYMNGIKWWFIMAEAHDGGFVVMPGRDYASTDHVYGTRNYPSAAAALILATKDKRLQITGAARTSGSSASSGSVASESSPKPTRSRSTSSSSSEKSTAPAAADKLPRYKVLSHEIENEEIKAKVLVEVVDGKLPSSAQLAGIRKQLSSKTEYNLTLWFYVLEMNYDASAWAVVSPADGENSIVRRFDRRLPDRYE